MAKASITALVFMSNETACLLFDEITDIIENCDIPDNVVEELLNINKAINLHNSVFLQIEPPPFEAQAAE